MQQVLGIRNGCARHIILDLGEDSLSGGIIEIVILTPRIGGCMSIVGILSPPSNDPSNFWVKGLVGVLVLRVFYICKRIKESSFALQYLCDRHYALPALLESEG